MQILLRPRQLGYHVNNFIEHKLTATFWRFQFSRSNFTSQVDYSIHYSQLFPSPYKFDGSKRIESVDVGCGFGRLLISLLTMFPESVMIGMEMRDKVTEYAKEKIVTLRASNPSQYRNVL